ncbi:MAG: helix-turn-helix transcriptional regulator [Clostridiaceae bacterium]|nr:helix-turn-helix transcriptional regulator [Clostridiaceae bacterium]
MATFKERLRLLRKSKNLTLDELEAKVDITKSTLSRYEGGTREPKLENIHALAEFLEVSTDYLLGLTDNPKPYPKLTEKDQKDIAKELETTMELLNQQEGLMFDGETIDGETKDLLRQSLENAMKFAKVANKKYTPKKYRKDT